MLKFDWDPKKEATNIAKHGVDFGEASTVFVDPDTIDEYDPNHSTGEPSFVATGLSDCARILTVWYAEPTEGNIRIIGARGASKAERRTFHGLG